MKILKFSQKFQILIGYSPKRAKICRLLGFLISFRIIKDLQNSIKLALIFIKLALSSQNSLKFMEICLKTKWMLMLESFSMDSRSFYGNSKDRRLCNCR